jgi:acyl transferase domain-containing protein
VTEAATTDLAIAVIGMACRFPGADSVEAFWENLRNGIESVSFFSEEELRASGVSPESLRDPAYVRAAAILSDVEHFDAGFFGYTAREAQALDPQHRLFLETAWEATERAGYDTERYRGSIGVFGGVTSNNWLLALMSDPELREAVSPYQMILSTDKDYLAPRVAYKLGLTGPALVIQSACSTSLVAVHTACQSLLAGECDMALAGGASVMVPQKAGYVHEPGGILSRDGHCRAFDAEASGTLRGSGVGLVVLKRLADALCDGDQIEAVIKGSAVNNDGAHKVGFTAPGVDGQARVIRLAQATAGVGPDAIGYVEAHGTATALGDPIEVSALNQVFRAGTERSGYCGIGSVKSNIGHLDAAAGIAGLIKVVLMLKHGELVPSLHFERPNPQINFADSPFFVVTRGGPWTSGPGPRCAGVSSFGIGGTNVHVVLQEPPLPRREPLAPRPEVLVLSARTQSALERATDALAAHLQKHPELPLGDVAFTLSTGRRAFGHRRALVCRDVREGAEALAGRDPHRVWSAVAEEGRPVAFLLSGQGAQYVGMARGLYDAEPEFRAEVDGCCQYLAPLLGLDLRTLLYPTDGEAVAAGESLNETCFTQPALFAIEYALARLWISRGVVPESMIGHSVGEYVAASLAGVLTRDDALGIVADRARLMQDCPRGAMTAVVRAAEAVRPYLGGRLDLCADNGPEACVVGGHLPEVQRLEARLAADGVSFTRVPTSHAFHSALMDPALAAFGARLERVRLRPPRVPFVSNLTGTWITVDQATDPGYWVRHLRATVRFSEGLDALMARRQRVLLEVGPGHALVALAKRRFGGDTRGLALASLRHPRQQEPDTTVFLTAAARLWSAGVPVDCCPPDQRVPRRRTLLPTYPFERERYWVGRGGEATRRPIERAAKLPVQSWLYAPSWKRGEMMGPDPEIARRPWCVFAGEEGIGDLLAARLREGGAKVTVVKPGSSFAWLDAGVSVVEPTRRADYERLVHELESRGDAPPTGFVHSWSLGGPERALDRGLVSVLRLGEVLGRSSRRETSLTVVTSGAQEVLGSEPLSPWRATVLGPCRVIPQEYPLVACRAVDVDVEGGAHTLVDQLLAEMTSGDAEPSVAYRGRYRWVQSFDPITPGAVVAPAARLRPRGVYLVTGGLGNIGRALAAYLARTVRARLVLTSRHGLPDRGRWDEHLTHAGPADAVARKIRAVRELEALGAEVLVVRADVADLEQMGEAVALTRERFGPVDGVIHAAGEMGPGIFRPLAETEPSDCERQLRVKLGGAEVLDTLFGRDPLDFVLLASSLSTVLGGLGFGAYAAANHALDTFARCRHQEGKTGWTSICWDGWRFEPQPEAARLATTGILPAEGEEVLASVLALGRVAQVVVSTTSLPDRREQWTRARSPGSEAPRGPERERHARPDLSAVYVAPEDPVECRLAALWAELLGIDRVGAEDNFFELGGSSLLAVHLMSRVKRHYPVELSAATLFEAPSVRALSRIIKAGPASDPALARGADRGQLRKESRRRQRRTPDAAVD